MSPASVAKIFSGYITNWDAPEIAADNERVVKTPIFETKKITTTNKGKKVTKTVPVLDSKGKPKIKSYSTKTINIDLPKQQITVWYRTDSSGTSENFTRFLKGANATNPDTRIWPKAQNTTFANGTPNNISTFFKVQQRFQLVWLAKLVQSHTAN